MVAHTLGRDQRQGIAALDRGKIGAAEMGADPLRGLFDTNRGRAAAAEGLLRNAINSS